MGAPSGRIFDLQSIISGINTRSLHHSSIVGDIVMKRTGTAKAWLGQAIISIFPKPGRKQIFTVKDKSTGITYKLTKNQVRQEAIDRGSGYLYCFEGPIGIGFILE